VELFIAQRTRTATTEIPPRDISFVKWLGCNDAIDTVRQIVERFVKAGNALNLRTIDISKAYDQENHHDIFLRPLKRNLLVALIVVNSRH